MEDKSQRHTWVRLEKMEGGVEKEMFDSTTWGGGEQGRKCRWNRRGWRRI